MNANRVFTEQELKEMGTPGVEAISAAIDAGDGEKAKKLARRMHRDFLAMHDLLRDWVTGLLTFVGERYGDEALLEAGKASCAAWFRPMSEIWAKADLRRKVELLASGLRGHLQPVTVEEDDEKFVFHMHPCGSGGRLVLDGCYGPPRNFLTVKKAQPQTYGVADFPVYCTHDPVLEIIGIEQTGAPLYIVIPAQKIGHERCSIIIYKDPKAIPSDIYTRLGKKKPS